jgi:hypothetical protein
MTRDAELFGLTETGHVKPFHPAVREKKIMSGLVGGDRLSLSLAFAAYAIVNQAKRRRKTIGRALAPELNQKLSAEKLSLMRSGSNCLSD